MFPIGSPPNSWDTPVAGCTECHRTIYSDEIQRWDPFWRAEWSINGTCKDCSERLLEEEMEEELMEEDE